MPTTKINNNGIEELDYEDLLEEDIKVGDIIGIAKDIGDTEKSNIQWKFYHVVNTSGDNVMVCLSTTGGEPISLEQLDDENEKAFYLHIGFTSERQLWSPGNRNLHEMPVETVIIEVFELGNKECQWKTRTVDSIAEETGLQRSRIRRALQDNTVLFKHNDSGSWTYLPLEPKNKTTPTPVKPTPTPKVPEGRRRGSVRY